MKKLITLSNAFAICLLILATSCKENEALEREKTSISLDAPGLTIVDNSVTVSVTQDSTIAIDYSIDAPGGIQLLEQTIDGEAETISEATGQDEFTGQLIVDVPFENETIELRLEVTDEQDEVTSETVSVVIEGPMAEGGSSAFAFKLTGYDFDSEITATTDGSGGFTFGDKLQAAPVLFDEVYNVFENGVRNPVRDDYTQGQSIAITSEHAKEIYEDRGSSGPSYYETQTNLRISGKPIYRMPGASNTLKYPEASRNSPYPTGNKTIYIAWHVRSKYDATKYRRYERDIDLVELNESTGFIGPATGELYGETISGGGRSGRIVGISDLGISVEMDVTFEHNTVVTGETSGATFTVNTNGGGYGDNYQTVGSNKWLRVWSDDNSNDPEIRISWTQMNMSDDDIEQYDGSYWGDVGPQMFQKWALMEFQLTEKRMTAKVNGVIIHDGDASPLIMPPEGRVHPYMIGFNGNSSKTQITQEVYISDIYMDHTSKRFYLANAETIEAATKVELQRPIEWEYQKVKMKARFGNIDPSSETMYLIYSDGHTETAAVELK